MVGEGTVLTGDGYFIEVFLIIGFFDVGFGQLAWLPIRKGVLGGRFGKQTAAEHVDGVAFVGPGDGSDQDKFIGEIC